MRVRRRRVSLERICGGLAVAAVTLLACGESHQAPVTPTGDDRPAQADDEPITGTDALRALPDGLLSAGTSRASTTVEMASGSTRITLHGEGRFDYRRQLGELLITLPDDPGTGTTVTEPVTELFAPGFLYMKNRGAGVPPDTWVRMATAELPDGNLVTGGATDPITAAELLGGVRTAEELGAVVLHGERLFRFRGVTDIAAAARATDNEDRRAQLLAALDGFTETAVPFDAYLDSEGRLRRVRHQFSYAESGGSSAIAVVSTTLIHDFGTPVSISLPPMEETIDAASAPGG